MYKRVENGTKSIFCMPVCPTEHLTISELPNPSIDDFYAALNGLFPTFEAFELWKVQSGGGCSMTFSTWVKNVHHLVLGNMIKNWHQGPTRIAARKYILGKRIAVPNLLKNAEYFVWSDL